jgi:GNAT superfamily N-acetyltransferase
MDTSLLATYDAQVRTAMSEREPDGVSFDWDGPLLRATGMHRGFVCYRDLAGLTGAALDELIERTCAFFDARGESFEWKTHGHDQPEDLTDRLRAAGFVAEEIENVFVGVAAELSGLPSEVPGIEIRELTEPADFHRVGAMESEVWGGPANDWDWLADDLIARRAADPKNLLVFAAFAGQELVSAAWLVRNPGTEFAGLWGGSTLAAWRGRGIYRALIARRAKVAAGRGTRYLQVDASPDSTPILQRLGFVKITTTTPYVHRPPSAD